MAGDGYGLKSPVPVSSPLVLAELQLGGGGTAILLGGAPIGPRFIWWNFAHSDRDAIEQAKADWAAQRFPLVPGDQDGWVPLPGS